MESARVRGCVGRARARLSPRAPAGKPMPVAGETAHVRPSAGSAPCRTITVRLRCKPCPAPPPDAMVTGRRPVVARKLRAPQQATVGTKTRSAGRTPPRATPSASRGGSPRASGRGSRVGGTSRSRSCRRNRWTLWSLDGTARSRTGSEATSTTSSCDWRSTIIGSSACRSRSRTNANPRQADRAVRVELTAFSKGPVIRAEAAADDKMGALDLALDKMAAQMRRAADRRQATAPAAPRPRPPPSSPRSPSRTVPRARRRRRRRHEVADPTGRSRSPSPVRGRWWCARRPTTPARMTLDQALYEMELVGHDFYLFVDKESEKPVGRLPSPRLRLRRDLARPGLRLTRPGPVDPNGASVVVQYGPALAVKHHPIGSGVVR